MVTNGLLLYNVFWSFSHSKGLFWGMSDFRHTPISTYINHILIRLMVKTNINLDTSSSGWWYTNPSEKWWSSTVGMMTFPSEWKVIKFNGSKPPIRYIYIHIYIYHQFCWLNPIYYGKIKAMFSNLISIETGHEIVNPNPNHPATRREVFIFLRWQMAKGQRFFHFEKMVGFLKWG